MRYSVVIPVYNEEEALPACYGELTAVMEGQGEDYELVFVDDGSTDASWDMLSGYCLSDPRVKAIGFSRNFGHQAAVTCGMRYAGGEAVIIIDCDLQDPPSVIPKLIEKWKQGYEIVYGKRARRKGEGVFKKFTAYCYYRVMNAFSDTPMHLDTGDFRLLDRKAVNAINAMREHNRFLRGMNAWAGFKQAPVEYEREPRTAGKSKYTMRKMVKLASDGIIANSKKPLKLALKFGLFFLAAGVAALTVLAVFAVMYVCGARVYLPQAAHWTLAAIAFFSGALLTSHGVTNAYVGRIYDEVKNRPDYIVAQSLNLKKNSEDVNR